MVPNQARLTSQNSNGISPILFWEFLTISFIFIAVKYIIYIPDSKIEENDVETTLCTLCGIYLNLVSFYVRLLKLECVTLQNGNAHNQRGVFDLSGRKSSNL